MSPSDTVESLQQKLQGQNQATLRYFHQARDAQEKIDRLEIENENLHKELRKARQSSTEINSRLGRHYQYVERARYERQIIGNQLNKLQHRIARQRKANRRLRERAGELEGALQGLEYRVTQLLDRLEKKSEKVPLWEGLKIHKALGDARDALASPRTRSEEEAEV